MPKRVVGIAALFWSAVALGFAYLQYSALSDLPWGDCGRTCLELSVQRSWQVIYSGLLSGVLATLGVIALAWR